MIFFDMEIIFCLQVGLHFCAITVEQSNKSLWRNLLSSRGDF